MKKNCVLVTGGAGSIGSALARGLISQTDFFVVIVDNLSTGSRRKLPEDMPSDRWRFIKADVNRLDEMLPIFAGHGFEYVFHYAAMVGVKRTLENPLGVLSDIDGIRNLLHLSKSNEVLRFFFSSSSEVYGEPVQIPQIEESTPLNSRLPYAVVKNLGEVYLKAYFHEFRLPFTIFRFFNTYGPDQSADFVISRFIHQALHDEPITIYGDGLQTRTFCYVADNVETTLLALKNGLAVNETINVGSDEEITILDLARRVIQLTGSKSTLVHLPPLAEGDMRRRRPDTSKMKAILGRGLRTLDEGIVLTAAAIRGQVGLNARQQPIMR